MEGYEQEEVREGVAVTEGGERWEKHRSFLKFRKRKTEPKGALKEKLRTPH